MSQRHGPAVDVVPVRGDAELPAQGHLLDRERLVELVQVHFVAPPAGLLPHLPHGLFRGHHHQLGRDSRCGVRHDLREGLPPEPLRHLHRSHHDRRGAVVESGRIACCHRSSLLEDGRKGREGLSRGVAPRPLVRVHSHRPLLPRDFDRNDLLPKQPRIDGGDGAPV